MKVEKRYNGIIRFDKVVTFHDYLRRKLAVEVYYTDTPDHTFAGLRMGHMTNDRFDGGSPSMELIDDIYQQMYNDPVFVELYTALKQYQQDSDAEKFWNTCKKYFTEPFDFQHCEEVPDDYVIFCSYKRQTQIACTHIRQKQTGGWLTQNLYRHKNFDLKSMREEALAIINK